jgi:hypothetical protein
MSLINDALKRAGKRPTDAGAGGSGGGGAPMTPVELSSRPKPNFVLIGLLLACLLAGGYCYMQWKKGKAKTPQASAAPAKPATNAASSLEMPRNGLLGAAQLIRHTTNLVGQIRQRQNADTFGAQTVRRTNSAAAKTNAPIVMVASASTPSIREPAPAPAPSAAAPAPAEPSPPVNAAPAATGPFPTVKLQGIFYRLRNPTVLIDGETVKLGDTLAGGVKLVQINRLEIKVEWKGQTKTVALPLQP